MSEKKIRILYIESETEVGGAQVGLMDILRYLDRNIFEPVVIVPSKTCHLYQALSKLKDISIKACNFIFFPGFINRKQYLPIYSPFSVNILKQQIKQIQPDIVHANHIFAGKYAAKAASKAGIPSIITIRNVFNDKPFGLHKFVDERLTKYAKCVVFNSNTGCDILKKRSHATNIMAIRNGIKLERFQQAGHDPNEIKKKYNLPLDKKLFVTIGRLSYAKGQATLIEALPQIISKSPECHLVFVGNDDPESGYKEELVSLAGRLNVSEHISWIPFIDDVTEFYAVAFMTILPSILGEGLPRVIIESMASSVPPIASIIAGTPELIEDTDNGYLFQPGEINEIASVVNKCIQMKEEEYKKMCKKNITLSTELFDIHKMIEKYIKLYNNLLQQH